jgi:hypothetical protein
VETTAVKTQLAAANAQLAAVNMEKTELEELVTSEVQLIVLSGQSTVDSFIGTASCSERSSSLTYAMVVSQVGQLEAQVAELTATSEAAAAKSAGKKTSFWEPFLDNDDLTKPGSGQT